ncbi:DUF1059 domain-containing protein [Blastococcus xanthinilyticus]|uniref:Uncharacterized protein DUF1059 n=1 Tax=Blastococcus xanthinilyticus TaxID=1564164 RepID=A0A5S5CU33_9ACTN|nr:DUF1059 domain-containing protein [Blastococcus xanthinilyticus]TYP87270.1 uncharacterized protein DUF1059 [Blastococcus xanthinilyticus]
MKTFHCGDIIPGCEASFSAADEAGILAQTRRHAVDAHGDPEPGSVSDALVLPAIRTV